MKQTWTASEADIKKRLDIFVVEQMEGLSRSQVQKQIEEGLITLNGKKTTVHHFLKNGDIIEISGEKRSPSTKTSGEAKIRREASAQSANASKETPQSPSAISHPLRIIEETPDWIVIHKSCGILMHPDHDHPDGTLIDAVVKHVPAIAKVGEDPSRPGIVSRLDKDVSGLVVIAKTQNAFDHLKNQFGQHTVKKIYTALVYGEMEQEEGDIRFRIARSTSKARMSALPEGSTEGQPAWTHYDTIKRFRDASLLKLEIMTGRTHQIRAHLYGSQHPIVGDILYKPKNIKRSIETPRLMLQSTLLAFIDPKTGERVQFELPLDDDFANVLAELKKVT
jgi:23S rRNA pseudouridine1911/1915/1917 synthase